MVYYSEPYVRQHLSKVYMVLASTTAAAAVGALLQMQNIFDLGMLAAIASLVLVLGLHFYRDDGKNYYTRLGMLYAFGFCSGQTLGPLLGYIVSINPAIIVTALTGTFVTFGSLSLAALLAEQGKYLFLGGLLVSVINCMALLSLFNMIFKSYFVQIVSNHINNKRYSIDSSNLIWFPLDSIVCWRFCHGRVYCLRHTKYCREVPHGQPRCGPACIGSIL